MMKMNVEHRRVGQIWGRGFFDARCSVNRHYKMKLWGISAVDYIGGARKERKGLRGMTKMMKIGHRSNRKKTVGGALYVVSCLSLSQGTKARHREGRERAENGGGELDPTRFYAYRGEGWLLFGGGDSCAGGEKATVCTSAVSSL